MLPNRSREAARKQIRPTPRQSRLSAAIEYKYAREALHKQQFLPEDDLERLLSKEHIIEELESGSQASAQDDLATTVTYIKKHAPRTFAVLVSCDLVSKAASLASTEFADVYLPVTKDLTSLSGIPWDHCALRWFHGWTRQEMKNFCQDQWLFLAKVFSMNCIMEDLHSECRLPFLSFETQETAGSFSFLHKATIHHAHVDQAIAHAGNLVVAIKELMNTEPGAEKQHEFEVDALDMARKLRHDHIVKFVGGFRQYSISYLMFQWADGGNLRQFWNETSNWPGSRELIHWHLKQMCGIAGALHAWHSYPSARQMNCRHGDLKPENIVKSGPSEQGIFQIADLGLAKIHSLPTHMRNKPSLSTSGTFRYRSPEIRMGGIQKISRSYDMWSIGCIFLEWIVWLLYGLDGLIRFYEEAFPGESHGFFDPNDDSSPIQSNVRRWMDHIESTLLNNGVGCHSNVLRRLLLFIKERLLIRDSDLNTLKQNQRILGPSDDHNSTPEINLIPDTVPSGNPSGETDIGRAKSKELRDELREIMSRPSLDDIYDPKLFMSRNTVEGPPSAGSLSVPGPRNAKESTPKVSRQRPDGQANTRNPYATPSSLDVWNTHSDIVYAKSVFSSLDTDEVIELSTKHQKPSSFCEECSSTDRGIFSRGSFSKTFATAQATRSECTLCGILYEEMEKMPQSSERMLLREESSLTTARGDPPILSIVVGPTKDLNHTPDDIQRGFPILPTPGGEVQFRLLKSWLDHCDSDPSHRCKPDIDKQGGVFMPLRLVDLGDPEAGGHACKTLRLNCDLDREDKKYAALSHRWGKPGKHEKFRLIGQKLATWQGCLDFDELPHTFRDAIKVTKALGIRYLWIDTLCIIQDDKVDLESQIKQMEDIYRSAYLTLSATCAASTTDGFLKRQPNHKRNDQLQMPDDSGRLRQFYFCDPIDDFKHDVELSDLSKRGWVFQERALSRRIIHFTSNQVYWECGTGIRCESLTKLYNRKTSFLSDPEFPQAMIKQYKGMRILFFEEIYGKYSQLEFTEPQDRSVAMAGIETRLAHPDIPVFSNARYGILHDPKDFSYLPRTLLWRRSNPQIPLNKIDYPKDRQVPSWSWMAVMGPIRFVNVPFDAVEWYTDLESPFGEHDSSQQNIATNKSLWAVGGTARDFIADKADDIALDRTMAVLLPRGIKCLVLGTGVDQIGKLHKHYGLLVVNTGADNLYERIGVATFTRHENWTKGKSVRIRVV